MGDVQVPLARPAPPPPREPPQLCCGRCCLLKRAFCCLSLRTGTIVIAATQVFLCLFHLFLEIMYLAGVVYIGHYAYYDELTGTLPEKEARWGTMDIAFASLSGLWLLIELITLAFSLLLLKGAQKEIPGLVRAWLYFKMVNLIFGVVIWLPQLGLEFQYRAASGGVLLARGLVPLTLAIYMLVVVRSYWFQLMTEGPSSGREFRPPPPLGDEKLPGGGPELGFAVAAPEAPPAYREEDELLARKGFTAPLRPPTASFPLETRAPIDSEEEEEEEDDDGDSEEEHERGRRREDKRATNPRDEDEIVRPRATWGARVLPPLPPDHRLSRARDVSPPRPPPPVVVALHPTTPPPPAIPVHPAPVLVFPTATQRPTAL